MSRLIERGGYDIHICQDESLSVDLAEHLARLAASSIERDGVFTLLLSGGSTPRSLYKTLAQLPEGTLAWDKIYLFLGDERCVSHLDSESNYKMISESLLSHISIPSTNVFPTINQDSDPDDSAKRYEQAIRRFFKNRDDGEPRFSCALMGLGPDGHTASLFPGSAALDEREHLCVANYVPSLDTRRITLTIPVFERCDKLLFMVSGAAKSPILEEVIFDKDKHYPSQAVLEHAKEGATEFWIDEAASTALAQRR